jgi:hypothetical protein
MSDELLYHEVLDRLSIINDNLAEFVIDHTLMDTETELRDMIIGAAAILHDAYQKVGALKFDKFPDVLPNPTTPEAVIAFVGSHYDSMTESDDPSDTRFQVSVHDLLSSFRDWQE